MPRYHVQTHMTAEEIAELDAVRGSKSQYQYLREVVLEDVRRRKENSKSGEIRQNDRAAGQHPERASGIEKREEPSEEWP